jgi:hypothetical protein
MGRYDARGRVQTCIYFQTAEEATDERALIRSYSFDERAFAAAAGLHEAFGGVQRCARRGEQYGVSMPEGMGDREKP